jgi:hypothetical protein
MRKKAIRKLKQLRKSKEISSWFNAFSNNILPPVFFLFVATVALHFIPKVSNMFLRTNLGIISLASAGLSLYIITLMF